MKNFHSALDSIFPEAVSACTKTYFPEIALLVLAINNVVVMTKSLKILGKKKSKSFLVQFSLFQVHFGLNFQIIKSNLKHNCELVFESLSKY